MPVQFVEPVVDGLEGYLFDVVRQGAKKLLIRWRKIGKVRRMLKNLSFEFMKSGNVD